MADDKDGRYGLRKRSRSTQLMRDTSDGLDQLLAAATSATRILVFSGSGLSASSGMSTFSTKGGLYERAQRKFKLADGKTLFTYQFFDRNRLDAQAFFADIYFEALKAHPAPGHHALAAIHSSGRLQRHYTLNIDGLGERVGMDTWHPEDNPSGCTVEMHGNVHFLVCVDCGGAVPLTHADAQELRNGKPLPCSACCANPTATAAANEAVEALLEEPAIQVVGAVGTTVVSTALETAAAVGASATETELIGAGAIETTAASAPEAPTETTENLADASPPSQLPPDSPSPSPPPTLRFKVMMYEDADSEIITPEEVMDLMEEDAKAADLIVWVGISFQQSASTAYFRKVRRWLQECGRADAVVQAVVNPSDEALWNLLTASSNQHELNVLEVLGTADDVLPKLAAHMSQINAERGSA